MIKYIFSTGIGILLCGIAEAQHNGSSAGLSEINTPGNKSIVVPLSWKKKSSFHLPQKGNIVAYANETLLYSGSVKNHRLHSNWQSWYNSNRLCDSGAFIKGVPHGEWKYWDSNGQLLAVRHYDAVKLQRIKEEMNRSNPKSAVYPLTALYKKNRRRGERYIKAAYSFGLNEINNEHLSLQQVVENNVSSGKGYKPLFDECLHHGLYMNFSKNGQVKDSGYYKNGLRDGIWIHRNETDHSSLSGQYKNGIKNGEWKQYNASGRLMTFIFYNNKGEEQWRKSFEH